MAVYVDNARIQYHGKLWCHMFADSDLELHTFARLIDVKRCWFETDSVLRHYDITLTQRADAIKAGAIELDREGLRQRIRQERENRNESA